MNKNSHLLFFLPPDLPTYHKLTLFVTKLKTLNSYSVLYNNITIFIYSKDFILHRCSKEDIVTILNNNNNNSDTYIINLFNSISKNTENYFMNSRNNFNNIYKLFNQSDQYDIIFFNSDIPISWHTSSGKPTYKERLSLILYDIFNKLKELKYIKYHLINHTDNDDSNLPCIWTLILPFIYHNDINSLYETFMQSHIVLDPVVKSFIIEQNLPIEPASLWCNDIVWIGQIRVSKKLCKLLSIDSDEFSIITLLNYGVPPDELLVLMKSFTSIELLDKFHIDTLPPWVTTYSKFGISSKSIKSSSFLSTIKSIAIAVRFGSVYCVLYDNFLNCVNVLDDLKNNYLYSLTLPFRESNNKMTKSIDSMCLSSVRDSLLSDLPNIRTSKSTLSDSILDSSLITKKLKTNNSISMNKLAEFSTTLCLHCLNKKNEGICTYCEGIKTGNKRKFQIDWPAPLHKPKTLLSAILNHFEKDVGLASPLDDPMCIFDELKYAADINWKPNGDNSMVVSSPKELFPIWDHGLDFVEKPLQDNKLESMHSNKEAYKKLVKYSKIDSSATFFDAANGKLKSPVYFAQIGCNHSSSCQLGSIYAFKSFRKTTKKLSADDIKKTLDNLILKTWNEYKDKSTKNGSLPDALMEDCLELLAYYHPELTVESSFIIPNETIVHVVEYTILKYIKSTMK